MCPLGSHRLLPLAAALGALACSAEQRSRPAPDCSVEQSYELLTSTFHDAPNNGGGYFMAPNPGVPDPLVAFTRLTPETLDPALCGHTNALYFTTQGNHDWGSIGGTYGVVNNDASGFEGISFWAQSFYDRALTISLDDITSNQSAGQCIAEGADGFFDSKGYGQPTPNACNLNWAVQIIPNPWWTFYTIPFKAFTQGGNTPDARLKPNGIDRSTISRIVFRAPRDAVVENWFVNIAWYRKL